MDWIDGLRASLIARSSSALSLKLGLVEVSVAEERARARIAALREMSIEQVLALPPARDRHRAARWNAEQDLLEIQILQGTLTIWLSEAEKREKQIAAAVSTERLVERRPTFSTQM